VRAGLVHEIDRLVGQETAADAPNDKPSERATDQHPGDESRRDHGTRPTLRYSSVNDTADSRSEYSEPHNDVVVLIHPTYQLKHD
jgi:hypothetical protein